MPRELASRSRNILSREQAIEIFRLKSNLRSIGLRTSLIAEQYGVSAKTIRDIWIGRTWYRDTYPLETSRSDALERFTRKIGRPAGARDLKPRAKRQDKERESAEGPTQSTESIIIQQVHQQGDHCLSLAGFNPILSKQGRAQQQGQGEDISALWEAPKNSTFTGQTTEFSDPFHDDWPYWNTVMQCNF